MAPLRTSQGGLSWICGRGFDLGSSCTQRSLIDVLNLLFLLVFCLALLVGSLRRQYTTRTRTRDWVLVVVSVCSAATSVAYFVAGVWGFITGEHGFSHRDGVADCVRGVVWMALAVSLIIHPTKWARIVTLVWWVSFSSLISALNVKAMIDGYNLRILDMVSSLVNLLLLFSAFRLVRRSHLCRNAPSKSLSDPLLIKRGASKSGLGNANFFSRLTFSWLNPLMRLGYSKPLNTDDIPPLDLEDGALFAHQAFAHAWDQQREDQSRTKNLVLLALSKCYLREMILAGFYVFLRTVSTMASPPLLYALVRCSDQKDRDVYLVISLVLCLIVAKILESLCQRHWYFDSRRCGMRMRSALIAAVFQKQLKLSSQGRRRHSTGEIVNYIAVDAYRLGEFPWWFHMAWSLPLQLLLSVAVLFWAVGLGALPGLVPLIICGVLNVPFAKMLQRCQSKFMVAQDERLRSTSEVLTNMKIIKLQSWEEYFRMVIQSLREMEFKWLTEIQINKSYGTALYWMSPTVVSAVVFAGVSILRSARLDASSIFTVLATLRIMSEPVRMLPEALSVLIQIKVSLDRLDVFLLEDEIKEEGVKRMPIQNSDFSVRILQGAFSWDPNAAIPTLKSVDIELFRGQKIAVCGAIGAGKSSLLCAILGEIPKISGSVEIFGSVAYVSQTSWIQSGTIRDNILYGKPMNKENYEKAIRSCALDKDIHEFDHGDLTEIGQRGINMSGGQKQRIQLARAVYGDADIYLLDDPFSAVDAHTAAILFHDCVAEALAEKTVILVTHQVEFLAGTDKILVMEGGQVTQSGTYEELLKSGTSFEQLVNAHQSAKTIFDSVDHETRGQTQRTFEDHIEINGLPPLKQHNEGEISVKGLSTIQLTEDEEKERGNAGWKPYKDYVIVSNSQLLLALVIISQSAFSILQVLSSYWLAIAVQMQHISEGVIIGVYTIISVLSCLFAFVRSWFASHLGLKASKAFFSGLMDSVFKAPMLFFDSTPVGRILTRVSSDLSILDFDILYSTTFALADLIEVVTTILIMAALTWQVMIVAVPALLIVVYIQRYYQASARELVRINGTTKAPVTNYATETSLGAVTIRAFAMMEMFIHTNLQLIDADATLFFHTIAAMEWVLIRVEALQILIILTSTLSLALIPQGTISPGFVGLCLSYASSLTTTQSFLTRWYSGSENAIISVERIKQYMHIPSEPPAIISEKRPPPLWPHEGRIDLQDLKIRYRPNAPFVLKGITCTLRAGEKVGVVGRTGSGKTTLISALFRLVEPTAGTILIDNLDICRIGLKDLRMKLSIIPQEPTLFRGSVRSNLDPLSLYTDHEIWEALDKCQLKDTVSSLPALLDSPVTDDGENWSTGQRQLFCLGRILLRKNRILVLDEATASIDSATDAVLQRIIRQEFSTCTVITVAHRVPTVTDSDKVMVLSYGKMVEYEKPSKLMENDESFFSKLVVEYWSNCKIHNPTT